MLKPRNPISKRTMTNRLLLLAVICIVLSARSTHAQSVNPDDKNWDSRFTLPTTDGTIECMIGGPDGTLYIGGNFNYVEGTLVKGLAKWEGHSWSTVGDWAGGDVRKLVFWNAQLYAAGAYFQLGDSLQPVARLEGSTWKSIGNRFWAHDSVRVWPPGIYELAPFRGRLWAVGSFDTSSDGARYQGIATWDGTRWASTSNNLPVDSIERLVNYSHLASIDSSLYLALPIYLNSNPIQLLKQWDEISQSWLTLDSGHGLISSLVPFNHSLIASGSFRLNDLPIAKWDGKGWAEFGKPKEQLFGVVSNLFVDGERLLAVGQLTQSGATPAYSIGTWTGRGWSVAMDLVDTIEGNTIPVSLITKAGSKYFCAHSASKYALRNQHSFSGEGVFGVFQWSDSIWTVIQSDSSLGLDGFVAGLTGYNGLLCVWGTMIRVGRTKLDYLLFWDGNKWSDAGLSMDSIPRCVASFNNKLYVAGKISMPGRAQEVTLASWDGHVWRAIDSAILIEQIVGSGNALYATDERYLYDVTDSGLRFDSYLGWYPDYQTIQIALDSNKGFYRADYGYSQGRVLFGTTSKLWDSVGPISDYWRTFLTAVKDTMQVVSGKSVDRYVRGLHWSSDTLDHYLTSLASSGDELFASVQSESWPYPEVVGKLRGHDLERYGSPIDCNYLPALAAYRGDLVVGGDVRHAGTHPSYGIAIYHRPAQSVAPSHSTPASPAHLLVYPNPVSEQATISLVRAQDGPIEVSLYDELGRRRLSQVEQGYRSGLRSINLKTSNLSNGVYRCVVTAGQITANASIVVMH